MTNAELLAKIKAEIERRIKKSATDVTIPLEVLGKVVLELKGILSFLYTLESEKPMELNEEIKRFVAEYGYERSEDILLIAIVARHFAQWGAEHLANSNDEVVINDHKVAYDKDKDAITMEEIPNDLEEAAWEYAPDLPSYNIGGGYLPPQSRDDLRTAFKDGAKWQAKQLLKSSPLPEDTVLFNKGVEEGKRLMMEEAVEGYVVKDITGSLAVTAKGINLDGFKFGDKVHVIVLKKED